MNYIINIKKEAKKYIDKQPKNQVKRIYQAIIQLPKGDVKKIKNTEEIYRLRVGNYRILFQWLDNEFRLEVFAVGNRGEIYKRLQNIISNNKF